MNILVTGANGFIGKNICAALQQQGKHEILKVTRQTTEEELIGKIQQSDFIFHLAGVNRPKDENEFYTGNTNFTEKVTKILDKRKIPIVYTSSIQAERDNPYGQSKKQSEQILHEYRDNGGKVYIYRLPNVYGKWSRPNYNSVVATFCYNIARDLPIEVSDPNAKINLCYIDDVIEEFLNALEGKPMIDGNFYRIPVSYETTIGGLANIILDFRNSRKDLSIADMSNPLVKNLYSTYLSYLPEDQFSYPLKMNVDKRGSFSEFIRTEERGQISVNISKSGITKGNHWHHSKNEKFLVVNGTGVIRFRKIGEEKVIEYFVSGDKLEVIDIPVGYVHNIENLGDINMVTLMWANENFNPEKPDTYYEEV